MLSNVQSAYKCITHVAEHLHDVQFEVSGDVECDDGETLSMSGVPFIIRMSTHYTSPLMRLAVMSHEVGHVVTLPRRIGEDTPQDVMRFEWEASAWALTQLSRFLSVSQWHTVREWMQASLNDYSDYLHQERMQLCNIYSV